MNPLLDQMFAQAIRLPQIPHVMQEVVNSLRDENVSVPTLTDLVRNDVVISAKVLRLANSSYYGAGRSVASMNDAVRLIGLNAFRNLVIASSLSSAFPRIDGLDMPAFWRNSMLVGNLAHIVGRELDVGREMLFSAGLMHGIGLLLIHLCCPDAARAATEACTEIGLGELRVVEQQLLQTNRFEVGMELARRWNFPASIQNAIGHHDAPGDDLPAQVIHVAVLIAKGIQASLPFADMLAMLPPEMASRLHLDKGWFEEEGEVFDLLLQESATLV